VHYLQTVEPPVLPRLNEDVIEPRGLARRRGPAPACEPRVHGECDGIVIRHHTHHQLEGWGTDNARSVWQLAQGFFLYYARQFQWDKHLVSVTSQAPVAKSSIDFHEGQNTLLCIQDPLDPNDNCARSIGQGPSSRILSEFERACSLDGLTLLQEVRAVGAKSASSLQRNASKQVCHVSFLLSWCAVL